MAKVDPKQLPPKELRALEQELKIALHHPERRRDMVDLFCDLLLPSERVMLARRLRIAKQLLAGKTHLEIKESLSAGLGTIQTVDRWLEKRLISYRSVIPPMLKERGKNDRKKPRLGRRDTFTGLRRRYPNYFALVNMLLDEE